MTKQKQRNNRMPTYQVDGTDRLVMIDVTSILFVLSMDKMHYILVVVTYFEGF